MATIQTTPEQGLIDRRRAIAMALQQASMQPLQSPQVRGAKVSPLEGVNKIVQSLMASRQNAQLDQEQAGLTAQTNHDRLAQALSLSNAVTPQAQSLPMPMAQPQEAQIPGEGAVPAMSVPPIVNQLPIQPNQTNSRNASVTALAQALASSDPTMQDAGKGLLQSLLTGTREEKTQAAESARQLAGFQNQKDLQAQSQQFTGGQNDLNRAAADARQNIDPLSTAGQSAQIAIDQAKIKPIQDKEIDTFTSNDGYRVTTYQKPDGSTYERKGSTKVQPPAANNSFNLNNPTEDASTVKYIADQVRDNPLNWNLTAGNKTLQNQVRTELSSGSDVNRLTASTRQLGETADSIVPKIDQTIKKLDNPKFVANLGPAMGRWNEFLTGKYGSNDPELAQLRATLGLLQTGVMRAHVGARGGEGLLDKFEGLIDGKKMDAATLKGSLTGIREFLQGYRDKIHPNATGSETATSAGPNVIRYDAQGNRIP